MLRVFVCAVLFTVCSGQTQARVAACNGGVRFWGGSGGPGLEYDTQIISDAGGTGYFITENACPGFPVLTIEPIFLTQDTSWLTITSYVEVPPGELPDFFPGPNVRVDFVAAANPTGAQRGALITLTPPGVVHDFQFIVLQGEGPGEVSVFASSTEVLPSSPRLPRSTTPVTIQCTLGGLPIQCDWDLEISDEAADEQQDGHLKDQHSLSRPLGGLVPVGQSCPRYSSSSYEDWAVLHGTSDALGRSVVTLCAPEASGVLKLKVSASPLPRTSTSTATAETLVAVKWNGPLVNLSAQQYQPFVHIKRDPQHPGNNGWAHPNLAARLFAAAQSYKRATGKLLGLSDVGLPWGGLFDDDGLWLPPHKAHRTGINADIRLRDPLTDAPIKEGTRVLDPVAYRQLAESLRSVGIYFPWEIEAPGAQMENHWHVEVILPLQTNPDARTSTAPSRYSEESNVSACPARPGQIAFQVSTHVTAQRPSGAYRYSYVLANVSTSQELVDAWQIEVTGTVGEAVAPPGWMFMIVPLESSTVVHWYAVPSAGVAPGASVSGFAIASVHPPGQAVTRALTPVVTPSTLLSHEEAEDLAELCAADLVPASSVAEGPTAPTPPGLAVQLNDTGFGAGETLALTAALTEGSPLESVDAYVVLQLPTGQFLSLQLGGSFVPGVVPIVRSFAPFRFTGELWRYQFTGIEPSGAYRWFSALARAGTLDIVGSVHEAAFAIGPPPRH